MRAEFQAGRSICGSQVLIANNSGTSLNSVNNFYVKYLRETDDKNTFTRIRSRSQPKGVKHIPTTGRMGTSQEAEV